MTCCSSSGMVDWQRRMPAALTNCHGAEALARVWSPEEAERHSSSSERRDGCSRNVRKGSPGTAGAPFRAPAETALLTENLHTGRGGPSFQCNQSNSLP